MHHSLSKGGFVLSVGEVLKGETAGPKTYPFSGTVEEKNHDLWVTDPVTGEVTFVKVDQDSVLAMVSAKTEVQTICSRCSRALKLPVQVRYQQEFAREKSEDSLPLTPSQTVDLAPSLRDEILLSIPMKPTHKSCKIPTYKKQ